MTSPDDFLANIENDLVNNLPGWKIENGSSPLAVMGSIIIEKDGVTLDAFEVRVQLSPSHPDDHPIVYETGGKIERIPDQHISADGSACLFVEDEASRFWTEKTKLSDFINGPVYAYFVGQSVFAATGEWPFGERRHYLAGVLDFYREHFKVSDPVVVLEFLKVALKSPVKGHWYCPCGNGLVLRKCHLPEVRLLQKIVKRSRIISVVDQVSKALAPSKHT